MSGLPKTPIWIGVVPVCAGRLIEFDGRPPGDIEIRFRGGRPYFPLVTCLLLNLALSLLADLFRKR